MKEEEMYNRSASKWVRKKPNLLTDFSVRPLILDWCGSLKNKSVIDIGCGEGYVSRYCKSHGASQVLGIDISASMIEKAGQQEQEQPLGIEYRHASINEITLEKSKYNIALGVFLANYLTIKETADAFNNIYNSLKKGGKFIFSVPHPLLPFLKKNDPPYYFDCENNDYYSGRDKKFSGKVWCLDGTVLEIQMLHKTFADILDCLRSSGFKKIPLMRELSVPKELINKAPQFFQSEKDIPLQLVIKVEK